MREEEDRNEWEWSADEIKRVGYRVIDQIAEHLTTLPRKPVFRPVPHEVAARRVESPPPVSGQSPDSILDAFATEIAPFPFGNGHPRFYGWVNPPPALMGIFAEALAAAMNPSCAGGNHAAVYIEREVVNWFRQITGFPTESMGLLVSGGSMAALTALAVARHARCGFDVRAEGLQAGAHRFLFYRTGEAHGCHQKAIELLGFGHKSLRTVAHNRALQMIPSALDAAIQKDKAEGSTPLRY